MTLVTPELVVIGCPSIDRLVLDDGEVIAAGGAGFNTALAARIGGIEVGLVAAIPAHLRREIGDAFGPGGLRREGLIVRQGEMPSFRITYDSQQSAVYLGVELGTELTLTADDIPEDWLTARHLHIGPLGASSRRQLQFALRVRERGFTGTMSAGSFLADLDEDRAAALELVELCELFFLNKEEMDSLHPDGPPGRLATTLCVTEGSKGATVHGPDGTTQHPAGSVSVVDPTGAGDAFCGGYLAGWMRGSDPVESAFQTAGIALSGYGSTALVGAVSAGVGTRVEIDFDRVDAMAAMLKKEAAAASLDFCGFPLPEEGEPWALECLALATLHQYGFWLGDETGWAGSMFATAHGETFKGSDYIWQAFTRACRADPDILELERLAADPMLFDEICRDDEGGCPVPMVESHRELQVGYAATLAGWGYSGFAELVRQANAADAPGRALLDRLALIPGYAEDPLAKKANLLLMILANRPEAFLDLRDSDAITPIIDYHLMRSCLRSGCVQIPDDELRDRLERRAWVDESEEAAVRRACFEAVDLLVSRSWLTQAAVDGFFFRNARGVCVEASDPRCGDCALEPVCGLNTAMFQPVIRTTAY